MLSGNAGPTQDRRGGIRMFDMGGKGSQMMGMIFAL